ncbi:F-box domain containing membrane protein [Entamoeba marina]
MTSDFTSLDEQVQIQIFSNLLPCDLLSLTATCKSIREIIINDDLLVQLALVDNYDNYACDEQSQSMLDFEKVQQSTSEQLLTETYPNIVKNTIHFHKQNFPHFDVFIPQLPSSYSILLLLIPLLCYTIPLLRCYSFFAPLCLFVLYFTTIYSNLKPTIDLLLNKDFIIGKTLQMAFLFHILPLLPLLLLPILLTLCFLHPIFLLTWFTLFSIPMLKNQIISLSVGYIISTIPIIFASVDLFSLNVVLITSIIGCLPLIGYCGMKLLDNPLDVNTTILELIIGLFTGGVIGCIWMLTFVPLVMTILIIGVVGILCGFTYNKLK